MTKRFLVAVVLPGMLFFLPAGQAQAGVGGPVITSIDHVTGPVAGAQCNTIRGTGFLAGATVTFGANSATVNAVTPTAISVVTPAGSAGPVDLTVTNPGPASFTALNAYTYTTSAVPPAPQVNSSPAAVGVPGPQFNLFDVTNSGAIEHTVWECNLWDDPESLGGNLASGPAASSSDVGKLEVFAKGGSGSLMENTRAANDVWSGWTSLGGVIAAKPGAVSWGPGRIDVVVAGTDSHVWHKAFSGGVWSGWSSLGGVIATGTGPAIASMGANLLEVFVRGTDKAVWEKTWNGTKWSGWSSLGGVIVGSPGAVSPAANQVQVFVRGTDSGLWYRTYTNPTWGSWKSLHGTLVAGPAAALAPASLSITDVFAQWTGNSIYEIRSTNGVWGAWAQVP